MLQGIKEYLDAARSNHGLRSDRALARIMGIKQMTVHRWRTGQNLPSDEDMRRLAQLAAADEGEAILLVNLWRAKDEPTRDTYRRLLRRLAGPGVAIAVTASIALGGPPDSGRNWSVSEMISVLNVYYGKFRRFSRRVAGALAKLRALRLPTYGATAPIAS